ncbi:cytochrome P450- family 96- subfamily A-polypeptide 10 [Striga hermonthica]|uniref:Cytochrome P450- family 96- subfamily A-polypeptide 10 n=1 Tax=Striga hermonthica TaxID=68872 RepID=A0A9N7NT16_STRHE|nr:cytochrome P450- family 96- subfamily A-polypeptide 10 [Striga hermonthica]
MATIFQSLDWLLLVVLLPLILHLLYRIVRLGKQPSEPTNWPVVGMLPAVLQNIHRAHDYATEVLSQCGATFEFKGPWLCNIDMVFTCDPANIHHIFSKNFPNYPKGPRFRKIFDILGDGIFNSDFELWEVHRRTTLAFLTRPDFSRSLEGLVWAKVQNGLLPVLDGFCESGSDLDLQDIFHRFTFDNICKLVLGQDPCSLRVGLPRVDCDKAFDHAAEPLLHRHIIPETIWKIQKWLNIGNERVLRDARRAFDEFIYPRVKLENENEESYDFNVLRVFKMLYQEKKIDSSRELSDFLRDTALSLMFAGRDTTSTCLTWLFWLLATNPLEERKVLNEIERELGLNQNDSSSRSNSSSNSNNKCRFFSVEESRKLNYLHGALCESLRLFPPVALEHKTPIRPDHLLSGLYLKRHTKVIISLYSVGRMEGVWGKDCLEFRPERWISAKGGIKHEPSYKFPAFNVGPRTCLGKEMAFAQMKMVAATILYRYKVRLVKGHTVAPRDSIILQARNGLRVTLSRRSV